MRVRDVALRGRTFRMGTPLGTAFVTVNEDEVGEPFEVFVNVGKGGSDTAAVAEGLGRLVSLVLRLPDGVPPRERAREVMRQLAGIGGGRAMGTGVGAEVRSLPDGVARVLGLYLGDGVFHRCDILVDEVGDGLWSEGDTTGCGGGVDCAVAGGEGEDFEAAAVQGDRASAAGRGEAGGGAGG